MFNRVYSACFIFCEYSVRGQGLRSTEVDQIAA